MDFKRSKNSRYPHRLIFKGEEVEVMRAVYRELIHNQAVEATEGGLEAMPYPEETIAGWDEDAAKATIEVANHEEVASRLDEFDDNTDEVISSIPVETGIPPFCNEYIYRRYVLGRMAAELAQQIREKAPKSSLDEEFARITGGGAG